MFAALIWTSVVRCITIVSDEAINLGFTELGVRIYSMTGRRSIRCLLGDDCPVVVVIDRRLDSLEILIDFHRIRGRVVQERIERADRIRCRPSMAS